MDEGKTVDWEQLCRDYVRADRVHKATCALLARVRQLAEEKVWLDVEHNEAVDQGERVELDARHHARRSLRRIAEAVDSDNADA